MKADRLGRSGFEKAGKRPVRPYSTHRTNALINLLYNLDDITPSNGHWLASPGRNSLVDFGPCLMISTHISRLNCQTARLAF